jgi:hypothetical protein
MEIFLSFAGSNDYCGGIVGKEDFCYCDGFYDDDSQISSKSHLRDNGERECFLAFN